MITIVAISPATTPVPAAPAPAILTLPASAAAPLIAAAPLAATAPVVVCGADAGQRQERGRQECCAAGHRLAHRV
ncbi:MAG: hypothetical protein NTY77_10795 [Elusimicrobia bacterium]|nr:hypothetical protein [Elusimicrobiota bacterium]